jgi:hypothetical protein
MPDGSRSLSGTWFGTPVGTQPDAGFDAYALAG